MKAILIGISVLLIVLISFLLISGRLGATAFTSCFVTLLLFVLGVFTSERLREIDFKNLRLLLSEVRIAKDDLAVTRKEINALVEDLAYITMSIASEKSIGPLKREFDLERHFERERSRQLVTQRITQMLKKSGWDAKRIVDFSAAAESLTRENIQREVWWRIYSLICDGLGKQFSSGKLPRPKGDGYSPKDYAPTDQVQAALAESNPRAAIKSLLEPIDLWDTRLQELLSDYESFCADFPCVQKACDRFYPEPPRSRQAHGS